MQGLIEYIVKGLVRHPDQVVVTPVQRHGATVYEMRLETSDVGRVVGRSGKTINALRSLLAAGSARKGIRCSLEIVEEGRVRQDA